METSLTSNNTEQTEAIAEKVGAQLRGGEVIQLIGDLGAGKTNFVRGLARGLDSSDHVSSPTFTISQVYSGRLTLKHFDFYRLGNDQMIKHELADQHDGQSVIVMEWAEELVDIFADILTITIQAVADEQRKITIVQPKSYEYIQL